MVIKALVALAADKPLEAMNIERRETGPLDVQIVIAFCGVCHSDPQQGAVALHRPQAF